MTKAMQPARAEVVTAASLKVGMAGAIAGGAIAAVKGINDVRKNKITKDKAAGRILREAGGTGVASGVATAVVGMLRVSGLITGALVFTGTAVGTKYLWNSLVFKDKKNGEAAEAKGNPSKEALWEDPVEETPVEEAPIEEAPIEEVPVAKASKTEKKETSTSKKSRKKSDESD